MKGKEFDLSKREALSYILGVLKGDGRVFIDKHNSGKVLLGQTREKFAKSFQSALLEIGLTPYKWVVKQQNLQWKDEIYIEASSLPLVRWFQEMNLKKLEEFISADASYSRAFLRGFYESEGSNYISENHKKSWNISLYNSDRNLLLMVKRVLTRLGFNFNFYTVNRRRRKKQIKNEYVLQSNRRDQNIRFLGKIKPCVKNKVGKPLQFRWWSRKDVLDELKKLAHRIGHSPSTRDLPDFLRGAINRYFGSLNVAKEIAGLETNYQRAWSKEKIYEELKNLWRKLGHSPTHYEALEFSSGLFSATVRYFGSWNEAKRAAGLTIYTKWGIHKEV